MSTNTQTLNKQERLSSDKQIESLFKDGSSFVCYPFRIIWMERPMGENAPTAMMVSVSKRKFKQAVDRNRVKRLMREAYRLNKQVLEECVAMGSTYTIAFVWIPSEMLSFERVNRKMQTALLRLSHSNPQQQVSENDPGHA